MTFSFRTGACGSGSTKREQAARDAVPPQPRGVSAYLDGCDMLDDRKGPLFRTIGRGTHRLSMTPLPQASAFQMVHWRAAVADIATAIGNHSFRATGSPPT